MTHLPKKSGKGHKPPHWEKTGKDVIITCPSGHRSMLTGHAVFENGDVFPGAKCPIKGCKFQGTVHLTSWADSG